MQVAYFVYVTVCSSVFFVYFSPQPHVVVVMRLPPWACWKQEYVFSQITLRNQSLVPSRLCLAANILRVSTLVYMKLTFNNNDTAKKVYS